MTHKKACALTLADNKHGRVNINIWVESLDILLFTDSHATAELVDSDKQ